VTAVVEKTTAPTGWSSWRLKPSQAGCLCSHYSSSRSIYTGSLPESKWKNYCRISWWMNTWNTEAWITSTRKDSDERAWTSKEYSRN